MTISSSLSEFAPAEPSKSEHKCSRCHDSKCCTYITQSLDTPRSKDDFETLLWQLAHRNVQVYKDSDGWFLLIDTPCRHLGSKGACGIYDERPPICRSYENDWCEFDEPAETHFDLYFDGYDSLLAYCKKRFKRWGK